MREPDVKKPQLQDYGLTPEEYVRYRKLRRISFRSPVGTFWTTRLVDGRRCGNRDMDYYGSLY